MARHQKRTFGQLYADEIFVNGQALIGGTQGKVIHVKAYSGSDGNIGETPTTAVKTLTRALALATANQGDIVLMYYEGNTAARATDYQAVALDWNKDGVHLIGVGAAPMIGQRARIGQLSTVKTIEDLFTLSADNCLIANIQVYQGVASSTATSPRAMVVSGQRNRIVNCSISGMGDTSMDTTGARSLAVVYPAAENTFQHCYIGLDTVIRATNAVEVAITGTGVATRVPRTIFEDCVFNTYTSTATGKMVAHTYTDRFVLYKNCTFFCATGITSAVAITGVFSTSDVNGMIAVQGSSAFGCGDWTTADDTGVYVSSFNGVQDDDITLVNIGIASTSDVVD
jgi:hypothetical protein